MNEEEAIKRRFELVTGELNERIRRLVAARNQTGDGLSLSQAVEAYRDEYLVERTFGRVIGHPLSLSPMNVEQDDPATGLVRLLSIALWVLTRLQFVARRQLAQEGLP
jgi:transposase